MEHKIILGGEKYLPYARSRITALRAAGLRYARQEFQFPDGQGWVKIVDQHDYIHLSGSGCLLEMDSGVVEIVGPNYGDGTLTETTRALVYNTPFIPTDPVSNWRVSPNATGQVSGTVESKQGFTGRVPYDLQRARSFAAGTVQAGESWSRIEDDAVLLGKKNVAIGCPPSIFTGRCRLWVQAMYGRPTYGGDGLNDAGGAGSSGSAQAYPTLASPTGAAPAIIVRARTGTAELTINTSTGVYLDTATGKHWLFKPTLTAVEIYPLVASGCGESLRKHLKADSTLTAEDKEHLEAYILSLCRPDVAGVTSTSVSLPAAYSMGYGWHWNWTGLLADMVVTEPFIQTIVASAMRSTHYRLSITYADGIWTASKIEVESAKDWAVDRLYWTITEPLWADRAAAKTTPRYTDLFACDAPFYAFYVRDTLKVCRVTVTLQPTAVTNTTLSDPTFAPSTPIDTDYNTLGMLGGYTETMTGTGGYYEASFAIGSENYFGLSRNKSRSGTRREIRDKVLTGLYTGGFTDYFNYTFGGGYSFYYGYPLPGSVFASVFLYAINHYGYYAGVDYHYETCNFATNDVGIATVIVPLNDAEAVFMSASITRTSVRTNRIDQLWKAGDVNWVERAYPETEAGVWGGRTDVDWIGPDYLTYIYHRRGSPYFDTLTSTATPADLTTAESTSTRNDLVCRAGAVPATFGNLSDFHNESFEVVAQMYQAYSSTSTDNPAVVSPTRITAVGVNGADVASPVFVGWA